MDQKQAIEQVARIKARYEQRLLKLPNVVGVGIGLKYKGGQPTNEVALVVNVSHKKPVAELQPQDIVPPKLEGVPVDVQEVGKISAW